MKGWDDLTEIGKRRRLRSVALAALEQYPLEITRLRSIGGFMNAVYRADTPLGTFAVRVELKPYHTDADVDVELGWLDAIATAGQINVPAPVRTLHGGLYTHATAEGVPEARRCAVFTWVPGSPIAGKVSPSHFERYGEMSARLHASGASYAAPTRPMAWDRAFYFPEDLDPLVWDRPENAGLFPDGGHEVVRRCIEMVEERMASIPDSERQIVHGDLHWWNVHVSRGEVWAVDFEDVMWATPTQDLAISLYYLDERPDRDELVAAFRRGYETVAPWPADDADLDLFMAARRTSFVNAVFNIEDFDVATFLERSIPKLREFIERRG